MTPYPRVWAVFDLDINVLIKNAKLCTARPCKKNKRKVTPKLELVKTSKPAAIPDKIRIRVDRATNTSPVMNQLTQ